MNGVVVVPETGISGLKKQFLLVDKMSLFYTQLPNAEDPEYKFLESRGVIEYHEEPELYLGGLYPEWAVPAIMEFSKGAEREPAVTTYSADLMIRIFSAAASKLSGIQTVPLCAHGLPRILEQTLLAHTTHETTLQITLGQLPCPGADASWQDILDFKSEERDKQWALRRFLNTISTKKQTEAEIRDDIEWCLNEYAKAMRIVGLKASQGLIEAYVIPTIEVLEDIAKFNWSKLAKGALSAKRRTTDILDAESRAPGRECGYVVRALGRFGNSSN